MKTSKKEEINIIKNAITFYLSEKKYKYALCLQEDLRKIKKNKRRKLKEV